MRHLFRKPPKQVIVPFDVAEFKAGDRVEWMPFMTRLSVYISQLEKDNEILRDMVDEKDDMIFDLQRENDGLHYDIQEFYRPVNPYTYNGVSPNDF